MPSRSSCAAAAAVASALGALPGCGDAALVVVAGDREVPRELDAICLAVADRDPDGGMFGRAYRLEGALAGLPQTLAVEAGRASRAEAWVRGFRGGVEVAADRAAVTFAGDVELRLDRCRPGGGGAPAASDPAGPGGAMLAASAGRGGVVIVAVGAGGAAVLDARGGAWAADALDVSAVGVPAGVVAIDVDGDCDDDLVVWGDAGARLYLRDVGFTDAGALTTDPVRAAAVADVDRDGDQDLVLGGGAAVRLWRADGGGLVRDDAAITGGGVTDVTALALGDLDGDGHPDLIVGQGDAAGAPPRALLADPSGGGTFAPAPAILPEVPLRVRGLALADVDGDGDLDLAVALADEPARLYVNRGGRLEDQSFVRLPQPAPVAAAVALAEWTGDCRPDLALAAADGTTLLRGGAGDALVGDAAAAGATAAVFADVDDDGDLDLVLATQGGVTWLRR